MPLRAPSRASSHPGRIVATVLAAVAVCVFFLVFADFMLTAGHVHPGVSIGGVPVGGMTPTKAAEKLASVLPAKSAAPIGVSYQGQSWTARPVDLGITFDYDSLVATAMAYGRTSGLLGDIGQRAGAYFGAARLPARASADPGKLSAFVGKITEVTDRPFVDASVTMQGTSSVASPSASGMAVDQATLTTLVLTAFTATNRTVAVPVHVRQPDVSDKSAEVARDAVAAMIAQPATVTWGTQKWSVASKDLAKMMAFRKVQASTGEWSLEPYVSARKATALVKPRLGGNVGHPARDAKIVARSGIVRIIRSQTGIGPDFESLSVALTSALKSPAAQPRVVALHTRQTQPKITTSLAQRMGIKERISTFTTTYQTDMKPRVNNIHVLGNALDGKLVAPGGVFSFNGAIGERTAAKGYEVANVIVGGKLVQALGGGICQVGTTLFNAVFVSGFPVIERHNHSFYLSHYPKGRDATVSWGGPDFKFKNTTKHWVLVATTYTAGSITISLYGTDPRYTVTSETGEFYNERPYPTETVKDPKLPEGVKLVEDAGETGRTCVVTRTVSRGGTLVRTDTFTSVYKPKVEVVRVGTKKIASGSKSTGSKN